MPYLVQSTHNITLYAAVHTEGLNSLELLSHAPILGRARAVVEEMNVQLDRLGSNCMVWVCGHPAYSY